MSLLDNLPHNQRGSKHRYSFSRAVNRLCENDGACLDGLEGEVSQEIARRSGKQPVHGATPGFFLPHDLPIERRGLMLGTTGSGSLQTTLAPTLIDVLRAKLVLATLGATFGDFSNGEGGAAAVPKKLSVPAVSWVSEDVAPTETHATIGQVLFEPHSVVAFTDLTRRLNVLAPDLESLVLEDLARDVAYAVDLAGVNGSGANQQPLGICQYVSLPVSALSADVGNGAAPAYTDVVEIERVLTAANGDTAAGARLGWLTSPNGRSVLRRTDLGGTTKTGKFVWPAKQNTILSWPAIASTSCPSTITRGNSGATLSALVFADWSAVMVQMFPFTTVLVNPYRQSIDGAIRLTYLQQVDVSVRNNESIVRCFGLVTT